MVLTFLARQNTAKANSENFGMGFLKVPWMSPLITTEKYQKIPVHFGSFSQLKTKDFIRCNRLTKLAQINQEANKIYAFHAWRNFLSKFIVYI